MERHKMKIESIQRITNYNPTQGTDEVDGLKDAFRNIFKNKEELCTHIDETLQKNAKRNVTQENVRFNVGIKVSVGLVAVDLSFGGERTRMYDNEREELAKAIGE